jgi:L-ascorbate metabolism protein UlaG (beta-lactamase superfamily)
MAILLRWFGYSFVEIISEKGKKILIDPFVTHNKDCPFKNIKDIKEADLILVTHGSRDHGVYEAPQIVKNTDAILCCAHDVAAYARMNGVKEDQISFICHGNVREFFGLKIRGMEAVHGSWITSPDGSYLSYGAMGFIVHTESNFRIYHLGDTSIIKNFEIFGQLYKPNIALLPIGGALRGAPQMHYNEAALSTLWLSPDIAIPIHYESSKAYLAEKFVECLKILDAPIKTEIIRPGETYKFDVQITCEKIQ